ncbi:MAG: polysaccharide biosynthesis tyrosine autokinase [Bacteroidia bacterium]|nr:polysaccharide biosynthesis tyrosine autokinase [Bacteroidia bacterium]
MNHKTIDTNQEFVRNIELFTSKWKFILICVILALVAAFLYLRYATYEYEASASIKIKDDQQDSRLQELNQLQNYGLFSDNFNNISDEVEILKSRTLIREVVDELDLNVRFFVQGRIKEREVYKDVPIVLSFFDSDSIVNRISTNFTVGVKSPTKFTLNLSSENSSEEVSVSNETEHAFGDRISTYFGDFVITPNFKDDASIIGESIEVVIRTVESTVEKYQGKISIAADDGSNVIDLIVSENLRNKASMVLDKLIEKYNDAAVYDKQQIVKATSDFINNRLELVSEELEQVDFTAEKMQKSNRLTALAAQSNIYLQSEKENEMNLLQTSNQIQLVDYMKDHLSENNSNADLLPADIGISDNSIGQVTKAHNDLVLQRNRILKNSSEKNPTVVNLDNQISALKENLNQSLDNIRRTNQITLSNLNREDTRIRSQIYSAPTKERQFRDIKRQQDIKESLYLYLLEKREETAISLGLSSPNARIVDAAYASVMPITPKPKFVYLAALILGLALPTVLIYLSDVMDTKVHNRDDISNLVGAPFIGDIPKSSSKKKDRLIAKVDYSSKAEAFRMIRTNLDFMLKGKTDDTAKIIFITSTMAQEGKSHTAANLATSLSYSEKKVLMVDTDIRIPKLDDYLGIENNNGFTDFISDPKLSFEDVIVSPKNNNFLDVIPSGTIPPNPAELMQSERVAFLFNKMKLKYDYIIVDTAAVGLVTDTLLICDHADMFIYVVSAEKLDKRQLHVARSMYEEKRLPNMAILLNGTRKKDGYGYGYGYGNKPGTKKKWYQFG